MPSPYPQYQPAFTPEELAKAQQVIRQHNASLWLCKDGVDFVRSAQN